MEIVPYLVLFAVVLGVNLLPAFGPPTWTIIVLYGLNSNMPAWLIVPIAALAAASGRFLLANAFRVLANHVSQQTKKNLKAAREAFARNRKGGIAALGLFALSPLPSAQLFEAAGLAGVRLLPFTAAFFVGRLVSYSIYAASAKGIQQSSLGDAFREGLTSPIGIGLQVAMIAGLVALARVDWEKLLKRGKA
jgi:uncharacterized membrane protein YdjX (TVP38/TMEM64 family)